MFICTLSETISEEHLKECFLNEEFIMSRKLPFEILCPLQKVIEWYSYKTYLLVFCLDYITKWSLSKNKNDPLSSIKFPLAFERLSGIQTEEDKSYKAQSRGFKLLSF